MIEGLGFVALLDLSWSHFELHFANEPDWSIPHDQLGAAAGCEHYF